MENVIEIRRYINRAGKDVFDGWLSQLADTGVQAKVAIRINRLAAGNFGDCKRLRRGLCELRIDWGPGYRSTMRCSAGAVYCFSAVATNGSSHQILSGHSSISRTTKKGPEFMRRKASISHDEAMVRRLRKDPDFAVEYLKAALEDEDEPRVLLIALRHLAQAQGIAKVAKAAGIERESLYRALSVHGNPRLSTLVAVTKAIGLRLTVEAI